MKHPPVCLVLIALAMLAGLSCQAQMSTETGTLTASVRGENGAIYGAGTTVAVKKRDNGLIYVSVGKTHAWVASGAVKLDPIKNEKNPFASSHTTTVVHGGSEPVTGNAKNQNQLTHVKGKVNALFVTSGAYSGESDLVGNFERNKFVIRAREVTPDNAGGQLSVVDLRANDVFVLNSLPTNISGTGTCPPEVFKALLGSQGKLVIIVNPGMTISAIRNYSGGTVANPNTDPGAKYEAGAKGQCDIMTWTEKAVQTGHSIDEIFEKREQGEMHNRIEFNAALTDAIHKLKTGGNLRLYRQ